VNCCDEWIVVMSELLWWVNCCDEWMFVMSELLWWVNCCDEWIIVMSELLWWVNVCDEWIVVMSELLWWVNCCDEWIVVMSELLWWVNCCDEWIVVMSECLWWVNCCDEWIVVMSELLWLVAVDLKFASPVVLFFCRHTFHQDCLPAHVAVSSDLAFRCQFLLKRVTSIKCQVVIRISTTCLFCWPGPWLTNIVISSRKLGYKSEFSAPKCLWWLSASVD